MEFSKRSSHSNAFLMDLFGVRKVVLFDTLLEMAGVDCTVKTETETKNEKKEESDQKKDEDPLLNSEQQENKDAQTEIKKEEEKIQVNKPKLLELENILAVIAHEIGHQKEKHLYVLLFLILFHAFIFFYLFSILHKSDIFAIIFGFISRNGEKSEYRQAVVTLLGTLNIMFPILTLTSPFLNFFKRQFEFRADQYANKRGQDLSTALVLLSQQNLLDLNTDPIYTLFHLDHPPLADRLQALNFKGDLALVEKRNEAQKIQKEYEEKKEKEKEQEMKIQKAKLLEKLNEKKKK
ncbi:MAG: putative zinc metallopeptidase STE24 [Streblomastix strix]|uniref:Putative zinc metallopeptidase STE24 n=1 Tax=Streblomastix strix TaxID=222440 RepID=A0A5J4W0N7_9EUKA|nr:MAG: putative zinc metallopeptidase STE24 [Streblomastix strix]